MCRRDTKAAATVQEAVPPNRQKMRRGEERGKKKEEKKERKRKEKRGEKGRTKSAEKCKNFRAFIFGFEKKHEFKYKCPEVILE